jgi:hypothetical protein
MTACCHCRPASFSGSAFSKLAAGVSLTPLRDLAYAFGQSVRDALFGSNVLVSIPAAALK